MLRNKSIAGMLCGTVITGCALNYYVRKTAHCEEKKKKVVVIGAGYAGRTFVKTIDLNKFDVVLIDKHLEVEKKSFLNEMISFRTLTFYPQPNYVDSISDSKIVSQFMYLPDNVRDIEGECVNVDTKSSTITLKSTIEKPAPEAIPYDYLVFAAGSIPDTYNVKMNYNCQNNMWYFFKNRDDLQTLMTVFDITGLNDVVIMGGGITGVELASELSARILEKRAKDSNPKSKSSTEATKEHTITILEAGDRLLPKLDQATSDVITSHLVDKQHIKIITSANITEIDSGKIKLMKDGKQMVLNTVVAVWTCGVKPDGLVAKHCGSNTVLNQLQLKLPSVLMDGNDISTTSNVFAIGDCNNLLPKSAQNSKQQGKYLAQYFNSGFKEDTKPFEFKSQGSMIRLSDRIYMDSPVYTGMLPLWVHHLIIWLDL